MSDIVVKLADSAPGAGPGPGHAVDATVRVRARTDRGQRKYAEAWPELGEKQFSRWGITCDEGEAMGGEDSAPPPLVYFASAVAF